VIFSKFLVLFIHTIPEKAVVMELLFKIGNSKNKNTQNYKANIKKGWHMPAL